MNGRSGQRNRRHVAAMNAATAERDATAIPTNFTYSVRPWGERYQQTQRQRHGNFDGWPCAICGKDVKQDRVRYGGIVTTDGAWTLDPDHPHSQGWFVVGADCHRRFVVKS